jgi:hypothetical protein
MAYFNLSASLETAPEKMPCCDHAGRPAVDGFVVLTQAFSHA